MGTTGPIATGRHSTMWRRGAGSDKRRYSSDVIPCSGWLVGHFVLLVARAARPGGRWSRRLRPAAAMTYMRLPRPGIQVAVVIRRFALFRLRRRAGSSVTRRRQLIAWVHHHPPRTGREGTQAGIRRESGRECEGNRRPDQRQGGRLPYRRRSGRKTWVTMPTSLDHHRTRQTSG
jgi:hypothetical protein